MEFPATAVPMGLADGCPVGLQVVALPGEDEMTISVARTWRLQVWPPARLPGEMAVRGVWL